MKTDRKGHDPVREHQRGCGAPSGRAGIYIYIYIYVYDVYYVYIYMICIYIYIYIERDVYIYIYIYIYGLLWRGEQMLSYFLLLSISVILVILLFSLVYTIFVLFVFVYLLHYCYFCYRMLMLTASTNRNVYHNTYKTFTTTRILRYINDACVISLNT